MPYVNIKITREGATPEQKARLIQGATQLLVDVLGKNPKTTVVVIDEVDTDNWGMAGESITVRRARGGVGFGSSLQNTVSEYRASIFLPQYVPRSG